MLDAAWDGGALLYYNNCMVVVVKMIFLVVRPLRLLSYEQATKRTRGALVRMQHAPGVRKEGRKGVLVRA